jgi:hypothetical protein
LQLWKLTQLLLHEVVFSPIRAREQKRWPGLKQECVPNGIIAHSIQAPRLF